MKSLSLLLRLGCLSFLKALASIWRIRSRVTPNTLPTSSSVLVRPSSKPNLKRNTFSSLSVNAVSYTHL